MFEKDKSSFGVLGVPMSVTTPLVLSQTIEHWARDNVGRFVCMRDVASLMAIIDDADLASIHDDAAVIAPDGMPLAILGKLKGHQVERTCGPDLLDLVLKRSETSRLKHFFYGGKVGVAKELARRFQRKYPWVEIVGIESPPFRALTVDEKQATNERIKLSGADVVWVGMSSPKQDLWMYQNHQALTQTLVGVGAAFDFHSGAIKRAPIWMQKSGLEWAHRFASEPSRLWRRYLLAAPRFVWRLAACALTSWIKTGVSD